MTARGRFFVWLAALATLSLLPLDIKHALGTKSAFHDAGHLAAFALTAFLYLQWRRPRKLWLVWPIVFLAVLLEILQLTLYRNPFEWRDVATDSLGVALAVLVYAASKRAS